MNREKRRRIDDLIVSRLEHGVFGHLVLDIALQDGTVQSVRETFSRDIRD